MKRKLFALAVLLSFATAPVVAGGLMTNTNYHIAFDRMFARGATTEIDGVFSNPAGLVWGHEGLQFSLNFQKPWQRRNIDYNGTTYEGVASAPIVPALFASYKKDRIAVSGMIGIVGSGGFVEYDNGVPMFNVLIAKTISDLSGGLSSVTQGAIPPITPDQYTIDAEMKGKQYIYGGQLNFAYKIVDCLSAAVGIRANYYDGYYRGHVIAGNHPTKGTLAKLLLDVDQKGWGFTPIVSLNYHKGPLTLSARYEFRTKLNPKNDTNVLETELNQTGIIQEPLTNLVMAGAISAEQAVAIGNGIKEKMGDGFSAYTGPYEDGVRTRYDMPALLTVAAGYEFSPKLRAAVEYHFFDDKNAKMGNEGNYRQDKLTHGTHEFLAGVEYDINEKFTVSCGGQRTDYGLSDEYQQNTSFACDSYSVGLGGAWNINEKMRLNVSYFCSLYSDYEKQASYGLETYSRTNHVIGVGLDYKF
jgi:long-chain fatty acid transport protein